MAKDIPVQAFGDALVFVDADDPSEEYQYTNDGQSLVHVENLSGTPETCTHIEAKVCDFGHPNVNDAVTCPTGGVTQVWGAKNMFRFNSGGSKTRFDLLGNASVRLTVVSHSNQL